MKYLVNLCITNDVNDSERNLAFLADSEEEKNEWVEKQDAEKAEWNKGGNGIQSYRYHEYETTPEENFHKLTLADLKHLVLGDVMKILSTIKFSI